MAGVNPRQIEPKLELAASIPFGDECERFQEPKPLQLWKFFKVCLAKAEARAFKVKSGVNEGLIPNWSQDQPK